MMETKQRGKAMKKVALLVGMLSLMVIGALVGGSVAGANPLTYVTSTTNHPCTAAHPCSDEECKLVGAHGDDCLPPETSSTTTTTTTRTTTVPPHGCGVAGKDGEPGNDDCATTTTPPAVSTTTPPPTSSSTTTTPETSSTTETETTTTTVPTTTTTPTPPPCSEPPCGPTPPDHELPNTGTNGALIGGLMGLLLLAAGLAIRRTARQPS